MTDLAISKYLGKRRSREQWMQLVAGHCESGLSVSGYCEREAISAASFYRWRSRVGDVARGPIGKVARRAKARAAEDFVDLGMMSQLPVTTEGEATRQSGARVEVRLDFGSGIVLTVSRG